MEPEAFLDRVRSENETALSRLGSSKSLYAATGGEMDPEPVLRAAADAEYAAHETFAAWAEDEPHEAAAEAFADWAETEEEHYGRVVAEVGDHDPGAVSELQSYLRGLETTAERLGGFVGRTLATRRSKEQMTGFFVGQADPQTADLFRDLGADLEGDLERARDLLPAVCETDADWESALTAANAAVEAAYGEYTESLESMGVNPKPVC